MNLMGKTVVVTGATDGLGLAIAKQFLAKSARVIIFGRNQDKLNQVLASFNNSEYSGDQSNPQQIGGYTVDVRDLSRLEEIAREIGVADVLINNAGIWLEGDLTNNTQQEISDTIDTNLKGVIYVTKAFLPYLSQSPEAHIVNVSSTSGLRGRQNQVVYAASKYGVTGFTESLRIDLEKSNIKVSGFFPGGMRTNLFGKAGNHKQNQDWMEADKVAEVVLFMVERDANMLMSNILVTKRQTMTAMP